MTNGAGELQRRDTTISMVIVGFLLLAHFLLRPWLTGLPVGPDLLLGGLLLAALRVQAGTAAILGFVLGPLEAAMELGQPGAYALVLTLTGYLAARSRDILFADAAIFVAVYLFVGTWLARTGLILLAGGGGDVAGPIALAAVDAAATAVVCTLADGFASSLVRRT